MKLIEQAREWLDHIQARPSERQFSSAIPVDRVLEDKQAAALDGTAFEPEASYFSVRIVEMYLKNAGEYFRQFLPMAITLAEFSQGGQQRTLPFFLNNDKLREGLGSAGASLGLIQMKDVYVLKHVPVNADGLSLFCGLFRMVHQDFAAALLDLLAEIGSKVGGPLSGQGVDIARAVYNRLGRIVGMKDVEFRFGSLDGSALSNGSGYRMIAGNIGNGGGTQAFSMLGGRLYRETQQGREEITDFDYCVVALERLGSRATEGLLTVLPLHKYWNEVSKHLAERRNDDAEAGFNKLQGEILLTPDLTESDRLVALALYQKKWAAVRDALARPASGSQARGNAAGSFRKGLADEIDRRGTTPATRVAEALAAELRGPAIQSGDAEGFSAEEANRLVRAFKDVPLSSSLSTEVASLFNAARQRSRVHSAGRGRSL
jgi:hypothetical protein